MGLAATRHTAVARRVTMKRILRDGRVEDSEYGVRIDDECGDDENV
jgi:hypothetical protein